MILGRRFPPPWSVEMPTIPLKPLITFGIAATILCASEATSHAYQTGDAKWCLVSNKGADTMQWDCEYDSSDECARDAAVTGGFCAINPLWRADPSSK
jgi:hypothetical protein